MKETELIARLKSGDTTALAEVIRTYNGYVRTVAYNFSRGMLKEEDIDEITADVFCGVWNARANIRPDIGLRSYLSASARNGVKDRLKRAPLPVGDELPQDIPSDFQVEDAVQLNDMISCLYERLEQLSPDEREVFFRFYFNGESAERIAAATGLTKGAVNTRLHRIREKLKEHMKKRGYEYV